MSATATAWFQIHVCVLFWGFTAILGKQISLPALPLVWWRLLIVTGCLAVVPRVWRSIAGLSARLVAAFAGAGVLLTLHWITFYGSIKLANASVAATCMALGPAFLAVVEPWIARRRFDPRELALGLAVVPGVALVVGGVPVSMRAGLAVGVLSAFIVSFFTAVNKLLVSRADALAATALEMAAGAAFLLVVMPFVPESATILRWPSGRDALLLAVLAVVCTLLPFSLSLVALRRLTAFGSSLAVNLEPVYAIVLAIVFLGEQRDLSSQFYLGVVIIMAAVFTYPIMMRESDRLRPADRQQRAVVGGRR
jgi:drug/metabolite transporter (DMT)-like permease